MRFAHVTRGRGPQGRAPTHTAVPAVGPQPGSGICPPHGCPLPGSRPEPAQLEGNGAREGKGTYGAGVSLCHRGNAEAQQQEEGRRDTLCHRREPPRKAAHSSHPLLPQVLGCSWQGRASATAAAWSWAPTRDDPPPAHPTAFPGGAAQRGTFPTQTPHSWQAPHSTSPAGSPEAQTSCSPPSPGPHPPQGSAQAGTTWGASTAPGPSITPSQACRLPGGSHQT